MIGRHYTTSGLEYLLVRPIRNTAVFDWLANDSFMGLAHGLPGKGSLAQFGTTVIHRYKQSTETRPENAYN